jgi:hypothetical protein
MLVYVATPEQINEAFIRWIDESDDDTRRIVYTVYQWFMNSDYANHYKTVSGLISFSLVDWESSFRQWIEREIERHPKNKDDIRNWSASLIKLLSSDWGIKRKLIVKECLDDNDIDQHKVF